jgi:hypothetical protein
MPNSQSMASGDLTITLHRVGFRHSRELGDQLNLIRWKIYKSLFESSDSVHEIISAGRQRPGKHRIRYLGAVEYAGLFLLSGDIAVEDLDDAINVGNQYSCLQRFPCRRRFPKMRLMFHCMLQNDPDSSR